MEQDKIIEGNKLIRVFMGLSLDATTVKDDKLVPYYGHYDSQWGELMPVLDKIIQMEDMEVRSCNWLIHIHADISKAKSWAASSMDYLKTKDATMIGAYYFVIIEFINWYNTQPK